MKTKTLKLSEIEKNWWIADADSQVLGRLASEIAQILKGKHKVNYVPHLDNGDCVVVINAEKVKLTGNKRTQKTFYWHTGYPGGIKSRTADKILDGRFPERLLSKAVERMVPRGPLGRKVMKHLHLYAGHTHPHEAQQPEFLDVAALNSKNKR